MTKLKRNRYSSEFKESIVALSQGGKSANALAKEYGVSVSTVSKWINQDNPEHPELSEREKLLLKENKRLKSENDILKLVVVLLAKD